MGDAGGDRVTRLVLLVLCVLAVSLAHSHEGEGGLTARQECEVRIAAGYAASGKGVYWAVYHARRACDKILGARE